jgi:hypothetical protein
MNMGWGYYAVILGLIGACVVFLVLKKKSASSSSAGQKPPQRGIIK